MYLICALIVLIAILYAYRYAIWYRTCKENSESRLSLFQTDGEVVVLSESPYSLFMVTTDNGDNIRELIEHESKPLWQTVDGRYSFARNQVGKITLGWRDGAEMIYL